MDIRQKINDVLAPLIVELENELDSINRLITEKKSEHQTLVGEYTTISEEVTAMRDKIAKDTAALDKREKSIADRENKCDEDEMRFFNEAKRIQLELIEHKDEINSLDIEIENRKSHLKSISIVEKQKEILTKELSSLNDELGKKAKELKEVEGNISQLKKEAEDIKASVSNVQKDMEADIASRLAAVVLREKENADKSKELESKASDLTTVEKRWKKLYEGKGAGFKI